MKYLLALFLAGLLGGCASKPKQFYTHDRKWYQGEMDNSERSFFVDTFFNGR